MKRLGLERDIVDEGAYARAVAHFREAQVALPTLSQLADPRTLPPAWTADLPDVDPDAPHRANLMRVHWFNTDDRRGLADVPAHVVLTEELTGVRAPIVVAFGDRFPMITAHKVLAAYGCLAPRIVTGQFDPSGQRAIWPSTGNYCRGGVAISRILGCRGVAVLPEGMSRERFEWLERWVGAPEDVVRTPGSESNVKEIYDACAELERDPTNVILNQFCEFGNHLAHYHCTGRAMERVFEAAAAERPGLRLRAFVSATGSAGTLGAGDHLKDSHASLNVAVEALECPTLLYNGFGEHNIQGIGDKHVPYIHNVTNTDVVAGVSDRSTDSLFVLFNEAEGREWLAEERGLDGAMVDALQHFGLSSICNVLAAAKVARRLDLGPQDAVLTVATDGANLYRTEVEKAKRKHFAGRFDRDAAAAAFTEHVTDLGDDHVLVCTERDRDRIFNLGYFTWVEQQGVALEDFEARRSQDFWRGLRDLLPAWDRRIEAFNRETGVLAER